MEMPTGTRRRQHCSHTCPAWPIKKHRTFSFLSACTTISSIYMKLFCNVFAPSVGHTHVLSDLVRCRESSSFAHIHTYPVWLTCTYMQQTCICISNLHVRDTNYCMYIATVLHCVSVHRPWASSSSRCHYTSCLQPGVQCPVDIHTHARVGHVKVSTCYSNTVSDADIHTHTQVCCAG